MDNSKNFVDLFMNEEFYQVCKEEFFPHFYQKMKTVNGYSGVYIDFENFWFSLLDRVEAFLSKFDFEEGKNSKEINQKIKQDIINELDLILDTFINQINIKHKTEIRFIKAYADFTNLYGSKELQNIGIDVNDLLRRKGIQTITPYVRGYKDMSDRALILGVVQDLLHENENINKIFVIAGDIDYYPLFEFISHNYKKDYYIASFKSLLNKEYEKIFFMKNRIIKLDDFFENYDSEAQREKKQLKCFEDFVKFKKLDLNRSFDKDETTKNLNTHYYLNFNKDDIDKFILTLKSK